MRIWLLSDIHDEIDRWSPPSIPDADIAVVSGDVARGGIAHVRWLREYIEPHMAVISCLGNHEFYRSSIERERTMAGRASAQGDVHVLDDMTWTVGNVRFVGATLWTDYDLYNPDGNPLLRESYMRHAQGTMNDHRLIKMTDQPFERFRPAHARRMHAASLAYIAGVLATPFDGETVVVTHHGPSPRSAAPRWQGDQLTPAFTSDLEWLIERYAPALWVHGHTHDSHDYELHGCRVVCNPKGYRSENEHRFDPGLVIEVGGHRPRPPGY